MEDNFLISLREENAKSIGVTIREMDEMDIHEIEERLKIEVGGEYFISPIFGIETTKEREERKKRVEKRFFSKGVPPKFPKYEITSGDILKISQEELISILVKRAKISVEDAEKVVQDCLEWIDAKIEISGLSLTNDAKQALLATVVLAMKKTDEFLRQEIEVSDG